MTMAVIMMVIRMTLIRFLLMLLKMEIMRGLVGGSAPLPDNVRREILELGFPDDGYNYLSHLREIRNTGGGSAYFHNPKADLLQLPNDVKAYDASKVRISEASEVTSPKTLYNVAEKTLNVRVQKAVDPEIAKLLEEESEFGSDIDDLEEDFVVRANHPAEAGDDLEEDSVVRAYLPVKTGDAGYKEWSLSSIKNPEKELLYQSNTIISHEVQTEITSKSKVKVVESVNEKPRVPTLLDQQFDILVRQEYGSDSDDDYIDEIDIPLAEKLNYVLKVREVDDFDLDGDYKAPADILHDKEIKNGEQVSSAAEILRRCSEYAEKYENEDRDVKEVLIVEESSDESEIWDCETIVSTYSNLDNHPGRIGDPGFTRKKKLSEKISGVLQSGSDKIISLGGKERLPVDYLPRGKKGLKESVKLTSKTEQPKRKLLGQESKEEKKERKAAVKEEKREARRLKKETKELYRDEAKLAQKVAAVSGPSSIHLT
ncbi:Protein LTV1-like protein [Bienertia sinuspersici]